MDPVEVEDDEVLDVPVFELPVDTASCGSPWGQVLDPDENDPSWRQWQA